MSGWEGEKSEKQSIGIGKSYRGWEEKQRKRQKKEEYKLSGNAKIKGHMKRNCTENKGWKQL